MMRTRTLVLLVGYLLAAWVGRLVMTPGSSLALAWPAAGVAALWGLVVRSRAEALLMSLLVVGCLAPILLGTGFSPVALPWILTANLAVALGTRVIVELLRRNGQSSAETDRPAWSLRSTQDVSSFVLASAGAVLVSAAFAVVSIHVGGRTPTPDDFVAHVFRNLAGVILIAGTGGVLMSEEPGGRQPTPRPALVSGVVATLAIAVLVFGAALHMPLGHAMLLPLFWSAVRLQPRLAMLHAAGTVALTLALVVVVGGHPFGPVSTPSVLATRFQLFCIISGLLTLVISVAMDRSRSLADELAAAEAAARSEADRLTAVTATVPDGLAVVTAGGVVRRLNHAVDGYLRTDRRGHLALPAEPLDGVGSLIGEEDRPCSLALRGHPVRDMPVQVVQADGGTRVFEVSASPLGTTDGERAALLSFRDATARFQALAARQAVEAQLAHQAVHDALTGLLNRHGFDDELGRQRGAWATGGPDCGLLLLDLDNFKHVNDSLGHAVGDELLVTVATALRRCVRAGDVVARLGGDEFADLLPGAALDAASRVGHEIVDRVALATRDLGGEQRRVTASIGVVSLAAADRAGTDPLVLADMLMYEAKEDGRNTVATAAMVSGRQPRMGEQLVIRRRVEDALDGQGLELFLQPIMDVRRGRLRGAEALLRLREGDDLVMPGTFMPVVERTGLAHRVDTWVLREALRISAELRRHEPGLVLSANVAGPSVGSTAYLDALSDALDCSPVPEGGFVLEITETAAVADMDRAQQFTAAVAARGIGLALDDFGAGFGSFSYLKHLDFQYLKIDGEFVRELPGSHVDQSIVRSLVGVARDLGKTTIAEHVGTAEVLQAVRTLGVDHAQGYAVGRPVPLAEFVQTWLRPTMGRLA